VVAPDGHALDVVTLASSLCRDLRLGAIVIQAHHRREVARVDVRCIALGDERVGVRGVADDQYPDVAARVVVDGLALHGEDGGVGLEQVLALHARPRGRAPTSRA
jgi:hypothetical protein